ncbi:MAG: dTDP-4-dehydrorhamnose reductase [Bacteroidales bacterium]|nr:dTDP-4-dehydrorhamnose reductase [Bacteroidales bacterium]MBO4567160.1 dTDP-4-dehydrorhamnose reductase [Bacteroidales bacterium]
MNILVTGALGQLGSELRLVAAGAADNYIYTDVAELDITDREAVNAFVASQDVDVIINCAAFTDVDRAEDVPDLAERINAGAVANLAGAMASRGGLLVHISTDYVFGGESFNTPIAEDAAGSPTGVYGLTKLHGEQAILASGCRFVIIRTAWLYSEFGRNFVKTMLRLTSTRPQINVVFDQVGTPTYALDLARAIFKIVDGRLYEGNEGIYHYTNEGVCSWFDFARAIAERSGSACSVQPCHSSEFPSKVRRPAYSVLDKTKIKTTFGVDVPYWTDSLAECLSKIRTETNNISEGK